MGVGNGFLGMICKAQTTESKINKWDYMKLKSFYTAKEIINKVKRQPMEQDKIANHISDNTYKEPIQLNTKKANNPIKNGPSA